jgi:hypothetical protein
MKIYIGKQKNKLGKIIFETYKYSIHFFPKRKEEIFWGIKTLDHYDYLLPCHLPKGFGLGRLLFIHWTGKYSISE